MVNNMVPGNAMVSPLSGTRDHATIWQQSDPLLTDGDDSDGSESSTESVHELGEPIRDR